MSLSDEQQPLLGDVASSDKALTRRSLILIFIGLALAVFVASLDETIVATAAISIVSQFRAFHLYSWVSVAYLVCLNATQPLYGKLSDVFGRKPAIMFGLGAFLLGSIGCAMSPNIEIFIVSRCIAGIGAGGLTGMAFIVVADIFPLEERPKYQSILMSAFGTACVSGPILGGVITKTISWRWCFWINLPVCILTIVTIVAFLHLPQKRSNVSAGLKRVDFTGAITLVTAVICFMLPMSLGGDFWAWNSPHIFGLFAASAFSLAMFLLVEQRFAQEPIVPLRLLKNRSLIGAWLTLFFYGMVFFSFMYYLPVWFEVVEGSSPELIGVQLIPMLVGLVSIGIFYAPLLKLVSKIKSVAQTRVLLLSGCVMLILGTVLRQSVSRGTSTAVESVFLWILGTGMGLALQTAFVCSQSSADPSDVAITNSVAVFCENLGGSMGLSISAAVHRVALRSRFSEIPYNLVTPKTLADIERNPSLVRAQGMLTDDAREVVINKFVQSLMVTFRISIIFACLALLAGVLVKHRRRNTGADDNFVDNSEDP